MRREKINWAEGFDAEKEIYQRLALIQGIYVPKCYGEVECQKTKTNGGRALILSDVGGIQLNDEAAGRLELDQLEDMLWPAIRAVTKLGVSHDDIKLDNYMLVGDKIVVIDFDSSEIRDYGAPNTTDAETMADLDVSDLCRVYQLTHTGVRGGRRPRKSKIVLPTTFPKVSDTPGISASFLESLRSRESESP